MDICEKKFFKEFLNGLETNELCKIVRSIYHGGTITVNTRRDAVMILLSHPYERVLHNKHIKAPKMFEFLSSKGTVPTGMEKLDLCLAFQSLVKSQSDYIRPPLRPLQMSVGNNMHGISQNNNMMHTQPYEAVQQMPMQIPTSVTPGFIEMFAKHFYDLLNDLGIPGKNQLDCRHFYENCTMSVKMSSLSNNICVTCEDCTSTLLCLLDIQRELTLTFSPYLAGVKWEIDSHGLVKVHIGGTIRQGVGRIFGLFEQQFILIEDPQAEYPWRIFNTNLMMKSMDLITAEPTLSIQGPHQTNNLQIDNV